MEPILAQKRKKEDEKGYDLLEASFLEKGLTAAGDSRSIGLRAVGQSHSVVEKHHEQKAEIQDSEFKAKVKLDQRKALKIRLGSIKPILLKPKPRGFLPNQLKDKGGSDSSKGGGSGPKKA